MVDLKMQRRDFFSRIFFLGGGLFVAPAPLLNTRLFASAEFKSRIVFAKDEFLFANKTVQAERLLKLLDRGMQALFNCDEPLDGWGKIVHPGEVVGIKVNCLSGRGSTHRELVNAICERLQEAGIEAGNIIIWDRLNRDLEAGGFKISDRKAGLRCFGNDAVGFEERLETFGAAGSLVSQIVSSMCDVIINLPTLKDHSIAGVTGALKNMFGAIHNPNKYHLYNGNPYIADVNMLPSIRNKVRLTIMDAVEAQYEGGPSFMPQWRWNFNGLIMGLDRVALDYTAWQIIDKKRLEMGFKSLKESGREPKYIATAAAHGLGLNDPARIEVISV